MRFSVSTKRIKTLVYDKAFQIFIGIPLIMALYIGWPWILQAIGQPVSSSFGIMIFEPLILSMAYVMALSLFAHGGVAMNDQAFPETIKGCDTRFFLYLVYFFAPLLVLCVLLLGGRAV